MRVRIAQSHLDAGLTLDELERALVGQLISFDYIDRVYMEPVPRSRRTVNLAARIAGRAGAGQVVVSDAVAGQVEDETVAFEPMDPVTLKGVAHPVTLFHAHRTSD